MINNLDTDYFQVIHAGDSIRQKMLLKLVDYMDEVGEGADILLMNLYDSKNPIKGAKPRAEKGVYSLDYVDWFRKNELTLEDCIVRYSSWENIQFKEDGGHGYAPYAVCMMELANRKRTLATYRGKYKGLGYVDIAGRAEREKTKENTEEF